MLIESSLIYFVNKKQQRAEQTKPAKLGTFDGIGQYSEYVLDANSIERRIRRQVVLGSTKEMGKREALKKLQPCHPRQSSTTNVSVPILSVSWRNTNSR